MFLSNKQPLLMTIIGLLSVTAANASVVTCPKMSSALPFTMATLSAGAVTCWYGGLPPNGTSLMLPGENYTPASNNWKKVHGYGYSCDYDITNAKNTDCPVTQK